MATHQMIIAQFLYCHNYRPVYEKQYLKKYIANPKCNLYLLLWAHFQK